MYCIDVHIDAGNILSNIADHHIFIVYIIFTISCITYYMKSNLKVSGTLKFDLFLCLPYKKEL